MAMRIALLPLIPLVGQRDTVVMTHVRSFDHAVNLAPSWVLGVVALVL